MGYDVNRFSKPDEIKPEFVCSICREVLQDPVCTKCEHVFCRTCIDEWLRRDNVVCPIDRTAVHSDQLRPPPRFFRSLLADLQLRCSFCVAVLKLEEVDSHERRCAENPSLQWPCGTCGAQLSKVRIIHSCMEHLKGALSDKTAQLKQAERQRDDYREQMRAMNARFLRTTAEHAKLVQEILEGKFQSSNGGGATSGSAAAAATSSASAPPAQHETRPLLPRAHSSCAGNSAAAPGVFRFVNPRFSTSTETNGAAPMPTQPSSEPYLSPETGAAGDGTNQFTRVPVVTRRRILRAVRRTPRH